MLPGESSVFADTYLLPILPGSMIKSIQCLTSVIYTKEKVMEVWKFIFFLWPTDGITFIIISDAQASFTPKSMKATNSAYANRVNRKVRG